MRTRKLNTLSQGILWSKKVDSLDMARDKVYIIHQVLSYGNLQEIRQLFKICSRKEIVDVFKNSPKRIYRPSVFRFVKVFILGLGGGSLDDKKYVKQIF